jgi:hypothetical protein
MVRTRGLEWCRPMRPAAQAPAERHADGGCANRDGPFPAPQARSPEGLRGRLGNRGLVRFAARLRHPGRFRRPRVRARLLRAPAGRSAPPPAVLAWAFRPTSRFHACPPAALLLAGLLLTPSHLSNCGPFFPQATFTCTNRPELKKPIEAYLAAPDKEHAKFEAVYLLLRHPGLKPYLQGGPSLRKKLAGIDSLRENWWCSIGAAQQRRATEEWDRLSRIDTAPNYLGQADEVLVSVNRLFTDTAASVAPLSDSAPLRCPRAGPGSPVPGGASALGRGIGSTGGITVRGQRPR